MDFNAFSEKEEKFIDLYCIEKINSYSEIAKAENIEEREAIKKYKSINDYLAIKIGVDVQEVRTFFEKNKEKISEIQYVFSRFNGKKKQEFGGFRSFYEWYIKQERTCAYCKTDEKIIMYLFKENKVTSKKPGWNTGVLQIDRRHPDGGYKIENCVLACIFCNNAKSDLISDTDFEKYIALGIGEYIKSKYSS